MSPSRSIPAGQSAQDQLQTLTTAALVRLAVVSFIVLCILASFAYAAGRHLTGTADPKTVSEPIPTDLRRPSDQQPRPRQGMSPLSRFDLRRNLQDCETRAA
jgi:hypothetical protein